MTAIELLKEAKNEAEHMLAEINKLNKDAAEVKKCCLPVSLIFDEVAIAALVQDIDFYFSSPPSEKANELIFRIRAYIMREYCDGCDPEVVFEMTGEQAAREIEAFGQRWVPISVKPQQRQMVWITGHEYGKPENEIFYTYGMYADGVFSEEIGGIYRKVTFAKYWMPVLSAPEAQGEKNE